jgi:myo-inositol-hexaphosphate 3-phosphohydrolase
MRGLLITLGVPVLVAVADPATGIDGNDESDGSSVVNVALGPNFPQGLFVSQDGQNDNPSADPESTNFKLTRWDSIADALGPGVSTKKPLTLLFR